MIGLVEVRLLLLGRAYKAKQPRRRSCLNRHCPDSLGSRVRRCSSKDHSSTGRPAGGAITGSVSDARQLPEAARGLSAGFANLRRMVPPSAPAASSFTL